MTSSTPSPASRCGIDCSSCPMSNTCAGCAATHGNPFGGGCLLAACADTRHADTCAACGADPCPLKQKLIDEFNALGLPDLPPVTSLNALSSDYINLEYPLPNGQRVRFWPSGKIILGNQLHKSGADRCYGLAADEHHLLVCEYGENGADPSIVLFRRRL